MTAQNTEKKKKETPFFARIVANQLAEQLRDGKAPMQNDKPQNIPYNPCTGRAFHGINALNLMMRNRSDDRWMENQEKGAEIPPGGKIDSLFSRGSGRIPRIAGRPHP